MLWEFLVREINYVERYAYNIEDDQLLRRYLRQNKSTSTTGMRHRDMPAYTPRLRASLKVGCGAKIVG